MDPCLMCTSQLSEEYNTMRIVSASDQQHARQKGECLSFLRLARPGMC